MVLTDLSGSAVRQHAAAARNASSRITELAGSAGGVVAARCTGVAGTDLSGMAVSSRLTAAIRSHISRRLGPAQVLCDTDAPMGLPVADLSITAAIVILFAQSISALGAGCEGKKDRKTKPALWLH